MPTPQTISFEEDILGSKIGLAGLPYFNPSQDKVVHFADPGRLFISLTISDPVTLAPTRVWLRVDTLMGRLDLTP